MDLLGEKIPRNNTISILKSERMCSNGIWLGFIIYFRFENFRKQRIPNTSFSGTDCAKEIKQKGNVRPQAHSHGNSNQRIQIEIHSLIAKMNDRPTHKYDDY